MLLIIYYIMYTYDPDKVHIVHNLGTFIQGQCAKKDNVHIIYNIKQKVIYCCLSYVMLFMLYYFTEIKDVI